MKKGWGGGGGAFVCAEKSSERGGGGRGLFVKKSHGGGDFKSVYPYSFAIIPTDSDLKFCCYAGWVKNYSHCLIFPFPHFKLE